MSFQPDDKLKLDEVALLGHRSPSIIGEVGYGVELVSRKIELSVLWHPDNFLHVDQPGIFAVLVPELYLDSRVESALRDCYRKGTSKGPDTVIATWNIELRFYAVQ